MRVSGSCTYESKRTKKEERERIGRLTCNHSLHSSSRMTTLSVEPTTTLYNATSIDSDVLETRSVSHHLPPHPHLILTFLSPHRFQVTLEWKVTALQRLFDSTKGDSKSKCVKVSSISFSRLFQFPPHSEKLIHSFNDSSHLYSTTIVGNYSSIRIQVMRGISVCIYHARRLHKRRKGGYKKVVRSI